MKKTVFIVLFIFQISASQQNKSNPGDYSYIGDYCTPQKILKLPCFKDFCAQIDHQMDVWAMRNGSFQTKWTEL